MDEASLAEQFDQHRDRLRAIAYRMLGSHDEAEDAVQETWLRLQRSATDDIDNLIAWLTTVITRICLNVLRDRRTHPEASLEVHVPDPVIDHPDALQPEHEVLLADAVGMALMTVIQTLPPAERVAFVLHDSFAVPFEQIATIIDKTPAATRQLASRGRRKVRDARAAPEPDLDRQREVVDAFFGAARGGDLDGLVAVLDPDVVLRGDTGRPGTSLLARGADAVAASAVMFARPQADLRSALVNGAAGVVVEIAGRVVAVMAFTVAEGRIVAIDALNDPDRLARIDVSVLG
jgi:RNA polymerase sigma factor (sigma-70 family)